MARGRTELAVLEQRVRNPARQRQRNSSASAMMLGLASLVLFVGGFVFIAFYVVSTPGQHLRYLGTGFLTASAAFVIGCLAGLIVGIPRFVSSGAMRHDMEARRLPPKGAAATGSAQPAPGASPGSAASAPGAAQPAAAQASAAAQGAPAGSTAPAGSVPGGQVPAGQTSPRSGQFSAPGVLVASSPPPTVPSPALTATTPAATTPGATTPGAPGLTGEGVMGAGARADAARAAAQAQAAQAAQSQAAQAQAAQAQAAQAQAAQALAAQALAAQAQATQAQAAQVQAVQAAQAQADAAAQASGGDGQDDTTQDGQDDGSQNGGYQGSQFTPSTNLAEISDWLTKLLLGAGLVELTRLGKPLASLINTVARGLQDVPAGAKLTGAPVVISGALLTTYLVLGFLDGYIVTTLWYGRYLEKLGYST